MPKVLATRGFAKLTVFIADSPSFSAPAGTDCPAVETAGSTVFGNLPAVDAARAFCPCQGNDCIDRSQPAARYRSSASTALGDTGARFRKERVRLNIDAVAHFLTPAIAHLTILSLTARISW
jgi:hypothetical protein